MRSIVPLLFIFTFVMTGCFKSVQPDNLTVPDNTLGLGSDDPSRVITHVNYNPDEPGQTRVDHFGKFLKLIKYSTYAYYRENRSLPDSLDELRSSGWLLFEPLPVDNIEDLQIVDREISAAEEDLMNLEIIFHEPYGYQFAYVLPPLPGDINGSLKINRWIEDNLISDFEATMRQYDVFSPFIDSNVNHIRPELMGKCTLVFMSSYWMNNRDVPNSVEELLQSSYSVRTDVLDDWPSIPLGDPGSFYYGVCASKDIMVRYSYYNQDDPIIEQRRYMENDPEASSPGVIGQPLNHNDYIPIEETIPLVSSELPGWGLGTD